MGLKEQEFLKRLLATFRIEAEEHLQAVSSGLLVLEKTLLPEEQVKAVENIFREVHSLKGAARAVDRREIETVCQRVESVFALLKRGELAISSDLLDVLHQAVDVLQKLLAGLDTDEPVSEKLPMNALLKKLEEAPFKFRAVPQGGKPESGTAPSEHEPKEPPEGGPPPHATVPQSPGGGEPAGDMVRSVPRAAVDTVRVHAAKLDDLLRQGEEMISFKMVTRQRAMDLDGIAAMFAAWLKEWSKVDPEIRFALKAGDLQAGLPGVVSRNPLPRIAEFLDWNLNTIKSISARLGAISDAAHADHRTASVMVDGLLDDIKEVLMLPFSSLLEPLPKLVRDLSKEQRKQVDLIVRGGEVEVDKRILQELKDPLIHIVRNAVDHGLEPGEERKNKGKPARGTVSITIRQKDSSKVEIVIADDGAGIDLSKVKTAAVKSGLVSNEVAEGLGEEDVQRLVFKSGLSTSPIVTSISGRGLGLAIVQEKVEKLGGTLLFESRADYGTVFRILLPITLATFRGVLVKVAEQIFVVPTMQMEKVERVAKEDVKTVENRDTVRLDGKVTPLVPLRRVLEIPERRRNASDSPHLTVMLLKAAGGRIAFGIDELVGEQEVLVKGLGQQLARVRNISGATVLGNGVVAPILNVSDLLKSAVRISGGIAHTPVEPRETESGGKSILVVEDSITARTLLKNILEAAGYHVTTAVDGMHGFSALQTASFDLVVSDVEMPRMDGFALTAKIRSTAALRDLPVILVTALESAEDRMRGVEVGANAYMVKQSFDQTNLLDVIRRFI